MTGLIDGDNTIKALAGPFKETAEVTQPPDHRDRSSRGRTSTRSCARPSGAGSARRVADNQDGQGMRTTGGWSRDCFAPVLADQLYRTTDGAFKPMPADGSRPADLATTTTIDGRTVDFVVRRERGMINRFLYSIAMLAARDGPRQRPGRSTASTAASGSATTRVRSAAAARRRTGWPGLRRSLLLHGQPHLRRTTT